MKVDKIHISRFLIILFFIVTLFLAGCSQSIEKDIPHNEEPQIEESNYSPEEPLAKDEVTKDNKIPDNAEKVIVQRVVDGDTFQTAKGVKVRLIGVDTPESVKPNSPVEPYGKEASNFTRNMIEEKTVYLTHDVESKDQYGRTLAYIYLEDGTLYNELLVKEGYAQVMTIAPNVKFADAFLEAQQYARENNKGLWGLAVTKNELTKQWIDDSGNGLLKGSKSKIYHLPGGYYYDKTTNVVEWFKSEEEAINAGYRKSSK